MMAVLPHDRAALLVVRARTEGRKQRLIVRVLYTLDVTEEPLTAHVSSSTEEIYALVRWWLEAFLRNGTFSDDAAPGGPAQPPVTP